MSSDEAFQGFRIYRRRDGSTGDVALNENDLIDPAARSYVDRDVRPSVTYQYTVSAVLRDGSEVRSGTSTARSAAYRLTLRQNHPNPFNPGTTIRFELPAEVDVRLDVFSAEGVFVRRLVSGKLPGGSYDIPWDGRDASGNLVSSGVYFCRLKAGKVIRSNKMTLLK